MPESPRRKRFQFHLSTAIVVMFVAGGLMWANVRMNIGNPDKQVSVLLRFDSNGKVIDFEGYAMGYPFIFQEPMLANDYSSEALDKQTPGVPIGIIGTCAVPLIADIIVAIAFLFAIWFICEWFIRRRAARQGT